MIRSISRSLILVALAMAPLMAQTAAPPARRGAPAPTAKPIAKPAAPAAAAPAPASNLPSGTYAHFATSMGAFSGVVKLNPETRALATMKAADRWSAVGVSIPV